MTDPPSPACTCVAIRKAARHVSQAYDRCLAPTGLRTTQFSVLATLARGPRGIGALADELVMDRTTMSRALRPLERDGLVRIATSPDDRRGRLLAITPLGQAKLTAARPRWAEAQARLQHAYGDARSRALHGLLAALVASDLGPKNPA